MLTPINIKASLSLIENGRTVSRSVGRGIETVLDTGEKDLHAVVCLHSLFLDNRMFDDLVEAGRGKFRFVRPEFPGQVSRTAEVSAPISMDACAADILYQVDQLGIDRFSILGQSMGGDVAFRIAGRHSERVERLVVMGASAGAESPANMANFGAFSAEAERHGFVGHTADILMGILFARSVLADPDRRDINELWRGRLEALSPGIAHAARGVLERESALPLLPLIAAPTLVVSGVEDLARPAAWSDEIFEGIPDAQLLRLKKAGHSPLLEQPEIVIPAVLRFFGLAVTARAAARIA